MVDWMIEVLTKFCCDDQTFLSSVSLMDQFLRLARHSDRFKNIVKEKVAQNKKLSITPKKVCMNRLCFWEELIKAIEKSGQTFNERILIRESQLRASIRLKNEHCNFVAGSHSGGDGDSTN